MKTKQLLLTLLALFASITVSAMDFEVDGVRYSTTEGGVMVTGYNSNATDLVLNGTVTYEGTTYDVVSIGNYAFNGCSSLTSIGDLSACTSIGNYAFRDCSSLTSIGDLSACTSIGSYAFQNCSQLEIVNLPASELCILENSNLLPVTIAFAVPAELLAAYKTADNWKNIPNQIIIYGAQTDYDISVEAQDNSSAIYSQIGEELLDNVLTLKLSGTINGYDIMVLRNKMHNLHHLDLSDARIVANDYQYYSGCHTEDNIFPSHCFHNVINLVSIKLPTTITAISSEAFSNCSGLLSVSLPPTIQAIEFGAFGGCKKLSNFTFPENLKTIGRNVFNNCSNLTEIRIPSMVTSIGSLAFGSCSNLKDIWTYTLVPQTIDQNTFSNYSSATLHIQKTSHDSYYWNTEWSQFSQLSEFEGTYSQWLINNQTDYVIDDHTGVIDTEDGASGEIEPGSGLILNNTLATQKMGSLQIEGTETKAGSVIANDNNIETDEMHFMIDVNKSKWYFFSFPFRVRLSDIECEGSWIFRYYDGATRAENGSGGWKNLPTGTEYLEPGQGYIFQCNKTGKLDIKVVKENLDMSGDDQRNNLATYTAENVQDASWNFMGNPFTSYFDIDATGYEAPITIWNGSSYEAVRPGDDSYHLRPFQAFFVQKPENVEDIVFPGEERETYNQSLKAAENNAKRRAKRGVNPERLLVNLTISDGTTTDKTRVVFNNKKSMNYEMDCDASKFMTAGVPQLYTLDNKQVQYAINERPSGGVVLGYSAHAAGTYFIEATRMDKPMLLKDQKLGITFDLTNGVYEFETAAGTFNDRFTLVENNTTTGVADILIKTGVSVMPTDGGLAINGAEGKPVSIYGTDGKLISERNGNGQVNLQRGTYVVNVDGIKAKVMVK